MNIAKTIFSSLFLMGQIIHWSYGQDYDFDPCDGVEDGELVRGPINCAHYIVCDAEEPSEDFCEDGLYFNPETQECDDAENVQCDSDYEDDYGNNENEYDDEYNEDDADEDDANDDNNNNDDVPTNEGLFDPYMAGSCPRTDDPKNVVFIASSRSCSEYFLCYYGIGIQMHCTDSLHFNPMTNKCDFPKNANCRVSSPLTPNGTPLCTRDILSEIYPHPTQCEYYYYCRRGYLSIQQCPFFYYFDASTKVCRARNGYQC